MKNDFFGREYDIAPAGGETGQAFVATHEDEKFFLKRNSSPFLAALSVENIVPKLVWTRRVENGDVITAQKWVNCHILTREEMIGPRVAQLLAKIHHSENLQHMLAKIENCYFSANQLLQHVKVATEANNDVTKEITDAIHYLDQHVSAVETTDYVVCHGDVNHNNWIISEENELFLVDWDGAMLADAANDIGMILYQYIPRKEWNRWLANYGTTLTTDLHRKLKWYTICQTVMQLTTDQSDEANERAKQIFQNAIEDDEV
ncbi:phosphotransferase family protein [Listeria swaminathanii]|uniref:Phosphotransferase family protein n=1 Tax=Listeria swaminathanii TaxID=2713501 RepID=A0A7X1DN25_9LIST|nr:phosphotransferase family protein [Listeria swaminathanii]MCD2247575.1 phosphotransferase family protein [Listeria marthii]MBC2329741.1 phosphotransferase family protein [Listeria swaminathanii]MDT0016898.1 phosphotransferase family protein [Listeria swaminathanii]MDT0022334.1 phosphotransferase family protein [Listeria swaminathanii]MDT0033298.1 phosphotransferase family protein [Listeria swaminathanii]